MSNLKIANSLIALGKQIAHEDNYRVLANTATHPAVLIHYMTQVPYRGVIYEYIKTRVKHIRRHVSLIEEMETIIDELNKLVFKYTINKDGVKQMYYKGKIDTGNDCHEIKLDELEYWIGKCSSEETKESRTDQRVYHLG